MFYLLLAFLVTSVAILMFNHEAGEVFGLPIEAVASVTLLSSWLIYLVGGRMGGGQTIGTSLKQAAVWVLIGFGLVLGYSFKDDAKGLLNRVAGELVPGKGIATNQGDVIFPRSENGHFMVLASINGGAIPMMVDSGASSVVLSFKDAKELGIDPDSLNFSAPVSTANGRTFAASIRLNQMSVGGISVRNVPAMVSQEGALRESLLGMSFLNKLGGWSVSGDRLTMRP